MCLTFEERRINTHDFATKPCQTGNSMRTVAFGYNLFNESKINVLSDTLQ